MAVATAAFALILLGCGERPKVDMLSLCETLSSTVNEMVSARERIAVELEAAAGFRDIQSGKTKQEGELAISKRSAYLYGTCRIDIANEHCGFVSRASSRVRGLSRAFSDEVLKALLAEMPDIADIPKCAYYSDRNNAESLRRFAATMKADAQVVRDFEQRIQARCQAVASE